MNKAQPIETVTPVGATLRDVANEAREWLFDDVLPIWASAGHDAVNGGFFEQIDLESCAPIALAKRCRVQARQIYAFIESGRLGWAGPWAALARSGLDFMMARHRRADGLMRWKTLPTGEVFDDRVDNYDQAFALFALAHACAVDAPANCHEAARALLSALRRDRRHHLGGFDERPVARAPLLSNPHMHFFEAALAWLDCGPDPRWRDLAAEMAGLCQTRFIDAETGALREYFDHDWSPLAGEDGMIVEPGHQFEWAWLLARWRAHGGDIPLTTIRRLYEIADQRGVERATSTVRAEIWIDGRVKDAGARLWQQTERMKAALALARLFPQERARFEESAIDSWRGMQRFIFPRHRGLFRDKLTADGAFLPEPALASSLYHIVGALSELDRYTREARR